MAVFVNTFFEERVERLFDLAHKVRQAFDSAGLEYRVVGGLAAYMYAEEREADSGRLTKDIDIVIRRTDLDAVARAVEPFGLQYRHVAGVDMLVQTEDPSARRAVHMIFAGEKVREEYPEPTPELGASREIRGIRLVPIEDLIRMKLSSFRLRDQTHLKDLEELDLIPPGIEASLLPIHRDRLAWIRTQR
jgi:hypothetical protein